MVIADFPHLSHLLLFLHFFFLAYCVWPDFNSIRTVKALPTVITEWISLSLLLVEVGRGNIYILIDRLYDWQVVLNIMWLAPRDSSQDWGPCPQLCVTCCRCAQNCSLIFPGRQWTYLTWGSLLFRVRLHLLVCWSECRQSLLPSLKCHPSSKAFHEIRCSKFIPSSMLFWSNQLFFSFPMCFFEHFRETSPEANIRVCGELESKGFPRERLLQSE